MFSSQKAQRYTFVTIMIIIKFIKFRLTAIPNKHNQNIVAILNFIYRKNIISKNIVENTMRIPL